MQSARFLTVDPKGRYYVKFAVALEALAGSLPIPLLPVMSRVTEHVPGYATPFVRPPGSRRQPAFGHFAPGASRRFPRRRPAYFPQSTISDLGMYRTSVSAVILLATILLLSKSLYESADRKLGHLSRGPRFDRDAEIQTEESLELRRIAFPIHTESNNERRNTPHLHDHATLVNGRCTTSNTSEAAKKGPVVEHWHASFAAIEFPELEEELFPITSKSSSRVKLTLTAARDQVRTLPSDGDAKEHVSESSDSYEHLPKAESHSTREVVLQDASLERTSEKKSMPSVKKAIAESVKKPLSLKMKMLRAKIDSVLEIFYTRHLNTHEHCPWAVMHSLIAFGVDTQVYVQFGNRNRVNAIGWLCYNGRCDGQSLFYVSQGKLRARTGPGLQGHEGQFLAMLAQSKVKRDYPMRIDGHEFDVEDLVEYEQSTCRSGEELTFKLIGLVHYLPLDAKWTNEDGEKWDLPELIREELAQPIRGAACGGTHRMMGFSYAVRTHEKRKPGKLKGQWRRAKRFVEDYHKYAFSLQNNDGSFSSDWFSGKSDWGDVHRKLETTGHILEWLVYSLPRERLEDPRVILSVNYLATLMKKHRDTELKIGPQGHALRALALYEHRVFSQPLGQRRLRFAKNNTKR